MVKKKSKIKEVKAAPSSSDNDENCICSREGVKKSVKYYLQNTTLHGLKYIAEDKITIPERIFFGLSFILVVILSVFFISNIYVKWSASPIIITTSAKQTLTSEVPFPAITICNLNQALKSKVETITRKSLNFSLLMSLCDQGGEVAISYVGTWKYFKSILIEVAQPCNQMLLYCSFGSRHEDCSLIFNSVLTDDGLCCTFNALDPNLLLRNFSEDNRFSSSINNHYVPIDWTPEKGYDSDLPKHFYPRVAGGTGSRMGLTVILNSSSSEYYCSKSKSVGFKVLVHNPAELPKISNYGFLVTSGREARIPIEPVYQNAAHSIRSISKSVRRCLFSDEGDLVYYRTYSRKNCELECEAKILITKCNCILYYLPRIDPTVRICGPNDNLCTNEVQTEIESSDKNVSCASCLPGCFELSYRATLTSTTIVYGSFITIDELPRHIFTNTTKISDISVLHFYYLSSTFRSTTKSEVFGFTEFLSNTGGLLGLFMGFSIFSLFEIIFYITVRPYCASRNMTTSRRKKNNEIECDMPINRDSQIKRWNSRFYKIKAAASDEMWRSSNRNYKNNLRNILLQQQTTETERDEIHKFPYLD